VTIVDDRRTAGYEEARKAMIDSQLRTSGVNTLFVLQRMGEVARERHVPESLRQFAYMDRSLALGGGRWLPPPVVQGMMLQEGQPKATDRALVVDGGSGYLAELLRPLVTSVDVVDPASAAKGEVAASDYTLLMIDGAVEHIPEPLLARLAPDARIATGLVVNGVTSVAVGVIANGSAALIPVAEVGFPALPEFAAPKTWTF
jgi:protein-L-isoaspartate(D-aspartate) O-methyltransferase